MIIFKHNIIDEVCVHAQHLEGDKKKHEFYGPKQTKLQECLENGKKKVKDKGNKKFGVMTTTKTLRSIVSKVM
jgi:hypothetical protein